MKAKPLNSLFNIAGQARFLAYAGICALGLSAMSLSSTASASAKGAKVIYLTVTEECEYCSIAHKAFRSTAEQEGMNLTVKMNNYDAAEQATQVDQAIAEHPDAIAVWPADSSAIIPSLRKIKAAGIPLVVVNSMPDPKYSKFWDAYTGPNDVGMGTLAAQAMVQGFKEKGLGDTGEILMIIGIPGTAPQIQREQGFRDELSKLAPGIKIVAFQPGYWDQSKAADAAASLFTQYGKNVKGMYSQADNMLAGAVIAAQRAGIDPKSIVMVGGNCSIEGVNNIESGAQYASVLQSPVQDGVNAARAIAALLDGKKVEPVNYLPQYVITKTNFNDCYKAMGR
ncbi:sugar ABC transporter substrate-binding protein [Pseudomonas pudica]|uniref:Sugar ABC transporter substrate-binding protein n=1 Tax=Pseudomonas pudica TaxID=272772 RepID=A0ABS0FUI3_9PSED|nr:sugar ABC transporter substrate-binding protein [Pseudomonas pudica]MBF8644028.1 sugar ABC transporter substrate-binding protein [Pseudomonas pudica]MBF8758605.1 sugar ABC transporter substrate-binding protein [Pseudomonas pudica]